MTDNAKTGHNSVSAQELRAFVERIERCEDEVSVARQGVKDVYAEAKGRGYDTKSIRRLVALRKKAADELAEETAVLRMYATALGMEDVFA